MTTLNPQVVKGGLLLLDPGNLKTLSVIPFQYNPQSITRSFEIRTADSSSGGDRSDAQRLLGPPIETIRLEVEIDASERLEQPERNPITAQYGIQPELAALETILYPSSRQLQAVQEQAKRGSMEIAPMEAPLTALSWGDNRLAPVRLTELSVDEQFFDSRLRPIRARVTLAMRVLSVNDLGADHAATSLYMRYQQDKERMAALVTGMDTRALGMGMVQT